MYVLHRDHDGELSGCLAMMLLTIHECVLVYLYM